MIGLVLPNEIFCHIILVILFSSGTVSFFNVNIKLLLFCISIIEIKQFKLNFNNFWLF